MSKERSDTKVLDFPFGKPGLCKLRDLLADLTYEVMKSAEDAETATGFTAFIAKDGTVHLVTFGGSALELIALADVARQDFIEKVRGG